MHLHPVLTPGYKKQCQPEIDYFASRLSARLRVFQDAKLLLRRKATPLRTLRYFLIRPRRPGDPARDLQNQRPLTAVVNNMGS